LEAVANGEPTALRMAVEALGMTLELLDSGERATDAREGETA
jgi:hypothetical protein